MARNNSLILERVFSKTTLKNFINTGKSEVYVNAIRRYIENPEDKTNSECISELYEYARKNVPIEYYYKNTLLNRLLLNGRHNLKTTVALSELPIGRSIADFVLINGKGVVYEIKTELDNLDRLAGQIADYYKAFEYVSVVTASSCVKKILNRLEDSPVGVFELSGNARLKEIKKANKFSEKLDYETMFRILRKKEFELILTKHFGTQSCENAFTYYRECLCKFSTIRMDILHKEFESVLKKRMRIEMSLYDGIPDEMYHLVTFSQLKISEIARLKNFLDKKEA